MEEKEMKKLRIQKSILTNLLIFSFVCIIFLLGFYYYMGTKMTNLKDEYNNIKITYENKLQTLEDKYEKKITEIQLNKQTIFNDPNIMKQYILYKNSKVYDELSQLIVDEIMIISKKYNFPPALLLFIMDVESDFNIYANSGSAIGLMQINPSVWVGNKNNKDDLIKNKIIEKKSDLYKPRENIRAGTFILMHYLDICKGYDSKNELTARGFHNIYQCATIKYFGGNNKSYYEKIKNAIGDYWFFVFSTIDLTDNNKVEEEETKDDKVKYDLTNDATMSNIEDNN